MKAIFNTKFLTPFVAATMLTISIVPHTVFAGDKYAHKITSGGEIWGAEKQDSAKFEGAFPATMSPEKQGELACKIYFKTYFPAYHFFHRYLNKKNPECFCDSRVSGNHGIDFIGIPKRGHSKKPLLIIEAKYSESGQLKLKKTKTKGVQMSKEWCQESLVELYRTLAIQAGNELSKKDPNENQIECLKHSLEVVRLLLDPEAEYIRLATVYNPTTKIIDLYTPIAIA